MTPEGFFVMVLCGTFLVIGALIGWLKGTLSAKCVECRMKDIKERKEYGE